jgi:hypothetical protein
VELVGIKLVAVTTPETLRPDAVTIPTGDTNCAFVWDIISKILFMYL